MIINIIVTILIFRYLKLYFRDFYLLDGILLFCCLIFAGFKYFIHFNNNYRQYKAGQSTEEFSSIVHNFILVGFFFLGAIFVAINIIVRLN